MQRREFLKKFSLGAGLASVSGIATATAARGKDMLDSTKDEILTRLDTVEKRIDAMDASHKKTMKAILIVAGLSIGMDVSILI